MGDTSLNHDNNSGYRSPTFYYIGTLDPLGISRQPSIHIAELGHSAIVDWTAGQILLKCGPKKLHHPPADPVLPTYL